ncbi:MAG: lipo-like protein [Alphaproteobacteria bacterium]|nr:lipo-like protein [Alphaproteobacteria bacterium]
MFDKALDRLGRLIAGRLTEPCSGYRPSTPSDPETLQRTLQIGDVLLVEANQKVGTAIKYLSQSTWSHAALYVGDLLEEDVASSGGGKLVEAMIGRGVVATPLSHYQTYNTRICRPVGLSREERELVARFAIARIGMDYDTRNIIDLARYLLPTPPVPVRMRRRMIALGSGEPTRFICSTLIAQAFQSVRYPILPRIERVRGHMQAKSEYSRAEILHIRHHSLFTPRDFDVSPYFQIVKPTIEHGFDHHALNWADFESADDTAIDVESPASVDRAE